MIDQLQAPTADHIGPYSQPGLRWALPYLQFRATVLPSMRNGNPQAKHKIASDTQALAN